MCMGSRCVGIGSRPGSPPEQAKSVRLHGSSTGRIGQCNHVSAWGTEGYRKKKRALELQTLDLGLLSCQQICWSLRLDPGDGLAELPQPRWEPGQSHRSEDITASAGKDTPKCTFSADLPLSVLTSIDTVCVAFDEACWVKHTMQMCTVLHALLSLGFQWLSKKKKKVLLFLWSESFKKDDADCMLVVSSFLWICFMEFRCTKPTCITITFLQ